MKPPLEDVPIVSLEQYGAGPFGSPHLASPGATVIKIEDPNNAGHIGRYPPPFNEDEDSLFFESFNRSKSSMKLDIGTPAGREVFENLIRSADAVCSHLRGDVPAKLGIRYEDLKPVNPGVVCCSLSGFGIDGLRRKQPGHDYVPQALVRWMSVTGEPNGSPQMPGLSLVDHSRGLVAALLWCSNHVACRTVRTLRSCRSRRSGPATAGWPSAVPRSSSGGGSQRFSTVRASLPIPVSPISPPGTGTASSSWRSSTPSSGLGRCRTRIESLEAAMPCAPVHSVAEALTDEHTIAHGMIVDALATGAPERWRRRFASGRGHPRTSDAGRCWTNTTKPFCVNSRLRRRGSRSVGSPERSAGTCPVVPGARATRSRPPADQRSSTRNSKPQLAESLDC